MAHVLLTTSYSRVLRTTLVTSRDVIQESPQRRSLTTFLKIIGCSLWTRVTSLRHSFEPCSGETVPARQSLWSTVSGCHQHWTTALSRLDMQSVVVCKVWDRPYRGSTRYIISSSYHTTLPILRRRLILYCVLSPLHHASLAVKAEEFWSKVNRTVFVSATPGKFELELSNPGKLRMASGSKAGLASGIDGTTSSDDSGLSDENHRGTTSRSGGLGWNMIEDLVDAQAVIRPTGIIDPPVDIRPSEGQVSDLVQECKARGQRGERVLVTTLTKRMAGEAF